MPNTPAYRLIRQDQYHRMPWKNGLGETLEIQRYEDESGLRFRISQASVVEDGVFSDFSGLHRTLVLLSGDGMTLEHSGRNSRQDSRRIHVLSKALDMARFYGGDETHATLKNGKIEDLNIMVRETDTQAKVEAYTAPTTLTLPDQEVLFIGFYANQETLIAFQTNQTGETNSTLIPSQSLLCLKHDISFHTIDLINGNGILIAIYKKKE